MANNKKISELTELTELSGGELFAVAFDGGNNSVSVATLDNHNAALYGSSEDTEAIKAEVAELQTKATALSEELRTAESEITTLRNEVQSLSTEVATLKSEIGDISTALDAINGLSV